MNANAKVDLDLSTLGDLNQEVRGLLPLLLNSIPMDDDKTKARLNISIELKRLPDSATGVAVSYSAKPVYPKKAQSMLCRADLTGNLSVDLEDLPDRNLPFPEMKEFKKIEEEA